MRVYIYIYIYIYMTNTYKYWEIAIRFVIKLKLNLYKTSKNAEYSSYDVRIFFAMCCDI